MSSYPSPEPNRRRRTALLVPLALLPLAGVVALGWVATRDDGDGSDAGRSPEPSRSSAPSDSGGGEHPGSSRPLKGRTVVVDPGHNPGNRDHTREISRRVNIGTDRKECDTVGAQTRSGYAEAKFTLALSRKVKTLLEHQGAEVVLTQNGDRRYGPCVDSRARAGNKAHADAVVSVHADGAPTGARGFHVILPASVHRGTADTRAITGPSRRLGQHLVKEFGSATGTKPANYLGKRGLDVREDLGGLNLSRVPKVFLECGNMRDPRDAKLLTDPAWRTRAARGIASGITAFLRDRH
ncbi:N-acetylmuramoyl-L-alanine amidase [Streptomyces sp. NPDC005438]|uniref:N-acetylmuramoyl-L-alanine amidase n=1 Tax=Streptomyces sp. NPDC005438 TaxID=3156880 RepID=UPI0033B023F5